MADGGASVLEITQTYPEASSPAAGTHMGALFGSYVVTRMLGRGGMGIVYAAEHLRSGREVAIKLLPETSLVDPQALRRFLMEARSAARLDHPNVMAILEVGQRDGIYYMVMERAEAGSAADALRAGGAMSPAEATRISADVCRALAATHGAGMVHRDIKPANILINGDGTVKLGDFGLAKLVGQVGDTVTHDGQVVGTPSYMSPEQCQSESVDSRADIYSLGATYYALLTGSGPYAGSTTMPKVMFAHCYRPVPDPREIQPGLPGACAAIVRRAMAKDPACRYQTAEEMLADFEVVLSSSEILAEGVPESSAGGGLEEGGPVRIRDGRGRGRSGRHLIHPRPRRPRRARNSA